MHYIEYTGRVMSSLHQQRFYVGMRDNLGMRDKNYFCS